MPTIDQLAPATAAADTDEHVVSQAGVALKMTRAQILAGVQPQLALQSGVILGRSSAGTGAPEALAVGANLNLASGTLSATADPYLVSALPAGTVPGLGDLVPLGQGGTNTAVPYAQFMSGLPAVPSIDGSQMLVTPTGSGTSSKLADFAAGTMPLTGGTMTGPLTLAGDPSASSQASTKNYVDTQLGTLLPKSGGTMTGPLTLAGDPSVSSQAATKNYIDTQVGTMLPKTGGTLSGPLTLAADPTASSQAATKNYIDTQVGNMLPKTGGALSGPLTLAADPTASPQAATKNYIDTQVVSMLPKTGGALSGPLTLASDPTASSQAATKNYVDTQAATMLPKAGGALSGPLTLAADPTASSQASTKNYVDTQMAKALPLVGGTLSGALTLAADPSAAMQAATKEYVDTRVFRSGDTLTGPLILAANPVSSLQAATKGYVDTQVATALPLTGGSLTGALSLAADPTTSMQAATKEYVDTRVFRSGDTLTGPLILAASPVSSLQAATKGYTDAQVATALPLTGGSLSGALSLAADPTASSQAATKHYVDTQVATSMPLSGGTLSGSLTLAANPATALQAAPKQYVDAQVATALPLAGGTLTGPLTLSAAPTTALNAATKQYVDLTPGNLTGVINVKASPYNAQLNGTTDDTAAFSAAYQAAPAGSVIYVPYGVTSLKNPSSWGVPLTKMVKWIVDGTTLPDGTSLADAIPGGNGPASMMLPGVVVGNSSLSAEVSQGSSQSTDFAVFRSAYIVNHTGGPTTGVVAANARTDTIIYNSPNNFIWGGIDRLLWCGSQTGSASAPAQHVGRYIQTIRQSVGTGTGGSPLPQPQMWGACLEYRDTTADNSSVTNSGITCEMDWFGNGPDDGHNRQIQSLVVGQNNVSGAPMEISTVVGIYLAAGHTGHAYTVLGINIPFSTSVLDTTSAVQMTGAAAIRLASGHAIAFEPTVTYRLAFDSTTNVLRWYQGTLSYVVGKGISVGFQNVCTSTTTLPNYDAGNIVFLAGSGTYTITLPSAATVAAGTGFTFSASGSGTVSISPAGTDAIDNGPITLRQNDRYQIVSDGSSSWREVFRTNSVNPRFTGTPVLPSYTVAGLSATAVAGAKAFATNGRKPTEAAGAGTGVEVFNDGVHWISVCSGAQVLA